MNNKRHRPLENRIYKYKNPTQSFFCPLCKTERGMTTSPRLTRLNMIQIFLTSLMLAACLYPWMGVRSFFVYFVVFALFELAIRSDYKKQIPCPHCGFDATWYKKDVKVARRIVKDFWNKNDQKSSEAL